MAKRGISTGMTRGEKLLGIGLLAVYLFVLPLTADPMFDGIGKLFGTSLSEGMRNAAYHYILFALTLLVFGGFMVRTTRVFLDHPGKVLGTAGIGMVAFYGCNEIVWRVLQMVSLPRANLNDQAILAQISAAPRSTILILVFLSPVVEEALFRGYVFGNLREWSRPAAYAASSMLFALLHVWGFAVGNRDFAYLLLAVQYLVPGLVMAWCFERSGSLWGSILLHCGVNVLAVWQVV